MRRELRKERRELARRGSLGMISKMFLRVSVKSQLSRIWESWSEGRSRIWSMKRLKSWAVAAMVLELKLKGGIEGRSRG